MRSLHAEYLCMQFLYSDAWIKFRVYKGRWYCWCVMSETAASWSINDGESSEEGSRYALPSLSGSQWRFQKHFQYFWSPVMRLWPPGSWLLSLSFQFPLLDHQHLWNYSIPEKPWSVIGLHAEVIAGITVNTPTQGKGALGGFTVVPVSYFVLWCILVLWSGEGQAAQDAFLKQEFEQVEMQHLNRLGCWRSCPSKYVTVIHISTCTAIVTNKKMSVFYTHKLLYDSPI